MDAEQELKRRRERGRSAQAAFRKRQALAAQQTQQENKQLREALASIASVARHDDRRALVSAITRAAGAAGVDVGHLRPPPTSPRPPVMHEQIGPVPVHEHSGESENSGSNALSLGSGSSRPSAEAPREKADLVVARAFSQRPAFRATRCMMWMNPMRYIRIDKPPEDIVPYLGDGADTLAGRLFWAVMEHARADCHHEHHANLREPAVENGCLRRMVLHSPSMQTVSHGLIKAMVEARLEYRYLGYISAEYAGAADPDTMKSMRRNVVAEFRSRGQDVSVWVDAIGVEARVRSFLGPEVFIVLEQAARSPDSTTAHKSLSRAVDMLVANFICFGDGPRWNLQAVENIFSAWLSRLLSSRTV
ncbi:hypothetical protein BJ166DRAFT_81636 [Pestalotiopsis sp. NC0098]|nr:hypothetical protein BJ166DRAFT_81636 [Pestalotiopsis sp. NC0098]